MGEESDFWNKRKDESPEDYVKRTQEIEDELTSADYSNLNKFNRQKKDFLVVLERNLGHIKKACKAANIDRGTYYYWRKNDPDFETAANDIIEGCIDFVESKLMQNISEGKETSIIFYLKTRGKNRGYNETPDAPPPPSTQPITIVINEVKRND